MPAPLEGSGWVPRGEEHLASEGRDLGLPKEPSTALSVQACGTISRLGLHRSLLHGPLIWQTTTSKLIRARLEGAAPGRGQGQHDAGLFFSLPCLSMISPISLGCFLSPREITSVKDSLQSNFLPHFSAPSKTQPPPPVPAGGLQNIKCLCPKGAAGPPDPLCSIQVGTVAPLGSCCPDPGASPPYFGESGVQLPPLLL